MPWDRKRFKNGKVYVEVDAHGAMLVENGRVRHKYREDDTKTYSMRADAVRNLDGTLPLIAGGVPTVVAPPVPQVLPNNPGQIHDRRDPPDSPLRQLPAADPSFIEVHCYGNAKTEGPAASSAILRWGSHIREISHYLGFGVPLSASLHAIELGLGAVKKPHLSVRLYTQCKQTRALLMGKEESETHHDEVQALRQTMNTFRDLVLFVAPKGRLHPADQRAEALALAEVTPPGVKL